MHVFGILVFAPVEKRSINMLIIITNHNQQQQQQHALLHGALASFITFTVIRASYSRVGGTKDEHGTVREHRFGSRVAATATIVCVRDVAAAGLNVDGATAGCTCCNVNMSSEDYRVKRSST